MKVVQWPQDTVNVAKVFIADASAESLRGAQLWTCIFVRIRSLFLKVIQVVPQDTSGSFIILLSGIFVQIVALVSGEKFHLFLEMLNFVVMSVKCSFSTHCG